MSHFVRSAAALAGLTIAGIGLAGIQSASAGPLPRCHTSDLAVTASMGDPAAGRRYEAVYFKNITLKTCQVFGWPGLGLRTAKKALSTHTVRVGIAHWVTLNQRQRAYSLLSWTVVPTGDENTKGCGPTPTILRVIPPNETTFKAVHWPGQICGHRTITADPLRLEMLRAA
jgi:hypothetical protein